MAFIRAHILVLILLPLCIISTGVSYYRFLVVEAYPVSYQVDCDPAAYSCFSGYDEDTGDTYYYAKIQKYARDARAECGADVTNCADANVCLPQDHSCSVTYCAPDIVEDGETCFGLAATDSTTTTEP